MESLFLVLPIVSMMIGLYLITLGLWELKEGVNRIQFIRYMFTGLFLLFIFSPLMWVFGNGIFLR